MFLAAVAYQARTAVARFPQWFGGQGRAQWPIFLEADTAAPQFTIAYLNSNAERAGLRRGDALLKINGRPVTGSGVFGDELKKAHPGGVMHIEVRSRGKKLTYVNAGHNPPVVLRGCGIVRLETGGPIIGLLPQADYQQDVFQLQPGDLAVLYTDGISESMNSEDEEWGEERLIACIETCSQLSAREALDRIMSEAAAFASGAPQHDDMTLAVLRVV